MNSRKRSPVIRTGCLVVGSLFVTFFLLELSLMLMTSIGVLQIKKPVYITRPFLGDIDRNFGVWHYKNNTYRHKASCFDVTYTTNSYGARDKERELQSQQKRVVVIGDSMIEGVGVNDQKRMTNILEAETGTEHLNFGTSGHFGPVQYYLLYKHLASKFSHDAVIIGLLPDNDFQDGDYDYWMKYRPNRYRPYFVGKYPDLTLIYPEKSVGIFHDLFEFLSDYTYTFNALDFIRDKYVYKLPKKRPKAAAYSGYYDFTEKQLEVVLYSLTKIRELSAGKKVFLVVIPRLTDLQRFKQEGPPPLSDKLNAFCRSADITCIDLLGYMADLHPAWSDYYHACDGHWSEYGNEVVARHLLKMGIP